MTVRSFHRGITWTDSFHESSQDICVWCQRSIDGAQRGGCSVASIAVLPVVPPLCRTRPSPRHNRNTEGTRRSVQDMFSAFVVWLVLLTLQDRARASPCPGRHFALTVVGHGASELDVLILIIRGRSNTEIARELCTSEGTVPARLRSACRPWRFLQPGS